MIKWVKDNKEILLIMSVFALLSILFYSPNLWWDSAVFISMGKYIWSLGNTGLWEPARPIGLPVIIGAVWKLGIDPIFFGTIFNIIVSMVLTYVVYHLIKEISDKRTSLLFSLLFVLSYKFIFYSSIFLTDIPPVLLSLTAIYLIIKRESFFVSGVLIGLAIITRFTHLIFIPIILLAVFARKKLAIKNGLIFLAGVMTFILPFLILNFYSYGNPVFPFFEGQKLIGMVAMNYLEPTDSLFYLINIIMWMPIIALFAILSFPSKIDWKYLILMSAFILPLIYHSFFVSYRTMRYALIFMPFLYTISALGYHHISRKGNKFLKYSLIVLLMLQLIISGGVIAYEYTNIHREVPQEIYDFENYISNVSVKGEIWSSTPDISAKHDVKITELIYYPVFDSNKIEELDQKLNRSDIQLIFINSCDIPCIKYDTNCEKRKEEFLDKLSERFIMTFNKKKDSCILQIFEWKGDKI